MSIGPTQGAERHAQTIQRWKSHPWLARLLRLAIFLTPLVGAFGFTWTAGEIAPPEKIGVNRWLWIAVVFFLANGLLVVLRRATERLIPLVALMKLTLVFPDNAPSRTKATLRKSNSRTMLRNIEQGRLRGETTDEVLHGDYIVQLLKEVNDHDRLTRGHSERVRAYAEMIGEELDLDDDEMNKLRWSALLHDVGKLAVPYEVLNKDGRPTDEEWQVLATHPAVGGNMLEPLRGWLGDWIHSADQHHCRWDGTGYPDKLAGTEISLAGRLVGVADAFDVMTSARSYKKPLDPEIARQELTDCAGTQFDPAIVRAFLRIGLGRIRTVAGPLPWLMNLTGAARIPMPSAGATWAVATSAVGLITVGTSTLGGATVQPDRLLALDPPTSIVIEEIVDEPIPFEVQPRTEPSSTIPTTTAPTTTFVPATTAPATTAPATTTPTTTATPPPNGRPVTVDDSATTTEDEAIIINVLSNDTDPDGESVSVVVIGRPTNGTATLVGGSIRYTPSPNFNGVDEFAYTAADSKGLESQPATVTVNVTPVNDPPIVSASDIAVDENISVGTSLLFVATTDPELDAVSYRISSGDTTGRFRIDGSGFVFLVAPLDYRVAPLHTIEISVDDGNLTTVISVAITVNDVNDVPTAVDDFSTTSEDVSIDIAIGINDSDPDGQPLQWNVPLRSVASAVLIETNGTVTYIPPADYAGIDTFTYTVSDGSLVSTRATVTVTVNPVNDAPVATDDNFTTAKNNPITTTNITGNDSDPDDAIDPTTLSIVATTTNGVLTNNGDGTFGYTPNLDYIGTDSFTYTVTDPDGLTSNTARVTIATRSTAGLVISEYSNVGDALLSNDFIELYNASPASVSIEGWVLEITDDTTITQTITLTGASTLLPPGGHYLLATGSGQDQSLSSSLTDSFSARIRNGGLVVDTVGTRARNWSGTVPAALWKEGTGLPPLIDSASYTPSWERKSTRGFGNCVDTDDNSADFSRNFTASQVNPQSSSDPATPCGTPVAPTPPTHLVISEYRTDGPTGGSDEFAEIFNPTGAPLSLNGILLQKPAGATVFNLPNIMLAPGQHYLVGGPAYTGLVDGTGTGFSNSEGARLFDTGSSTVIDEIGIGVAPPFLPILDGRIDHSYERRFRGCQDSAAAMSWLDDFIHQAAPTPTRSTDPFTPC